MGNGLSKGPEAGAPWASLGSLLGMGGSGEEPERVGVCLLPLAESSPLSSPRLSPHFCFPSSRGLQMDLPLGESQYS